MARYPIDEINNLGRWKSTAYKYIRPPAIAVPKHSINIQIINHFRVFVSLDFRIFHYKRGLAACAAAPMRNEWALYLDDSNHCGIGLPKII
jgi:hypothetical protein